MAGPDLRTDNDVRFTDSTTQPDVKEHQQVHDTIAQVLNLLGIVGVTFSDGDALVYDSAAGLFVPTPITAADGSSPVATTYTTAAPGTVFRVMWAGGWPSVRPSSRTDIYFDFFGAPEGFPLPSWLQEGDNQGGTVSTSDHQAVLDRLTEIEGQLTGLGGGGGGLPDDITLDDIPNGLTRIAMTTAERERLGNLPTTFLKVGPTANDAKAGNYVPAIADIGGVRNVAGFGRVWGRTQAQGVPTAAEGLTEGDYIAVTGA